MAARSGVVQKLAKWFVAISPSYIEFLQAATVYYCCSTIFFLRKVNDYLYNHMQECSPLFWQRGLFYFTPSCDILASRASVRTAGAHL